MLGTWMGILFGLTGLYKMLPVFLNSTLTTVGNAMMCLLLMNCGYLLYNMGKEVLKVNSVIVWGLLAKHLIAPAIVCLVCILLRVPLLQSATSTVVAGLTSTTQPIVTTRMLGGNANNGVKIYAASNILVIIATPLLTTLAVAIFGL
jgi:predicted Na+-dependent transporter